jgi:hypothetical protein
VAKIAAQQIYCITQKEELSTMKTSITRVSPYCMRNRDYFYQKSHIEKPRRMCYRIDTEEIPFKTDLPKATANKLGQPQVPSAGACEDRLPSFFFRLHKFTEVAKMNTTGEFKLVIGSLYIP